MSVVAGDTNEYRISGLDAWLYSNESLTKKLKQCTGDASVHTLAQGLSQASWWDTWLFTDVKEVFTRQILMSSNMLKCWWAKTVMPLDTYEACRSTLDTLGNRSLGQLLFSDDSFTVKHRSVYQVSREEVEYWWVQDWLRQDVSLTLFLRKTDYCFYDKPFILYEIFLPQFVEFVCKN